MIFIYGSIILFAVCCLRRTSGTAAILSKDQTTTINGLFILLVFVGHALRYLFDMGLMTGLDSRMTHTLEYVLGQEKVVPFLFFSGYGVGESIKARGEAYVKEMPFRRCLNTLLNFDVAVLCFIAIATIIGGGGIDMRKSFLALLGWESYGNSNWYIFVIVGCYAMTAVAFTFFRKMSALLFLFIEMVALSIILANAGRYWFDTLFAYFFGIAFSSVRGRISGWLQKNKIKVLTLSVVGWLGVFALRSVGFRVGVLTFPGALDCCVYNLLSIFFVLGMVAFLHILTLRSRLLHWCGANLFPLYIYQRLPMIVLVYFFSDQLCRYPVAFVIASFILTLPFVWLFQFVRFDLSSHRFGLV